MRKSFNNTTEYIREKNDGVDNLYIKTSTNLLYDDRLSTDDKIMMIMILSNKDNYILNMTYLQKQFCWGQVRFYDAIKKLEKYKYLEKIRGYQTTKWIVREKGDGKQEIQKNIDKMQKINILIDNN